MMRPRLMGRNGTCCALEREEKCTTNDWLEIVVEREHEEDQTLMGGELCGMIRTEDEVQWRAVVNTMKHQPY
jgi:hypothetical protein